MAIDYDRLTPVEAYEKRRGRIIKIILLIIAVFQI